MIIDALILNINPIVDVYTAIGDVEAEVPFAVIRVKPSPLKTKDGIIGYTQKVTVALIDNDVARIETNTVAVRAAIENMSGVIEGCEINSVEFVDESGIEFDQESQSYQNSMEWSFDTENR